MSIEASKKVWAHSRVSGSTLTVMLALADFANEEMIAWPSAETIRQFVNLETERSVLRILAKLVEIGELKKIGRGPKGVIRYLLTPGQQIPLDQDSTPDKTVSEEEAPLTEQSHDEIVPPDQTVMPPLTDMTGDALTTLSDNPSFNHQRTVNNNIGQQRTGTLFKLHDFIDVESVAKPPSQKKKKTISEHESQFEDWWMQYPRKASKQKAKKEFLKLMKSGDASFEDLMAGVMRYAAERDGQDHQYTKHPSTWLSNGCWTDEPAPRPSGTQQNRGLTGQMEDLIRRRYGE